MAQQTTTDEGSSVVESSAPQLYDSHAFAIFAATFTLVNVVVGCGLFVWRRGQPMLSKRSIWYALALAACSFFLLEVPYREFFGFRFVTCSAHFTIVYALAAVLPAILALRYVELTSNHARQSEEVNASFGPDESEAEWPRSSPREGTVFYLIDRFLLRFRLHSKVARLLLLASWLLPWLIYYAVQAAVDKRLKNAISTLAGCTYLLSDHVMFVVAVVCYAVLLLPLLARLWGTPDSLGLRLELVLQVRGSAPAA